jgi:membrane-bound serine protease (ClpP class)
LSAKTYFLIVFAIFAIATLLIATAIISLWRHKKSGTGRIQLLGARAIVQSDLSPEGAVLIAGELWRARSLDGTTIAVNQQVAVVQVEGHLLLVKPYQP